MAAMRYRTARIVIGATVAVAMIGGTAYFTTTAPAQGATASKQDATGSVSEVTAPVTGSIRQVPSRPAPAKRTRGS